jgi:hypothetical protein
LLAPRNQAPTSTASCGSREAGIWARSGVVVDQSGGPTDGSLYIATGNGPFDAHNGGVDYGDSVLRVKGDASDVMDYYTPSNFADLDSRDIDLGSTAPALLPQQASSSTPWLLVQGGKDSVLRLVDRSRLGGVGGELQQVDTKAGQIFTAPLAWDDPQGGDPAGENTWVFVATGRATIGYHVATDGSGKTSLVEVWRVGDDGTSPILAGGVLFTAGSKGVSALDPHTGKALWRSSQPSAGGNIGKVHWQTPIVVSGRLYVADGDGMVTAYGLTGQ